MARSKRARSTTPSSRCTSGYVKPDNIAKHHKYHAVPTTVDGIRFASKAEARRYADLQLLLKAGQIAHLELQPEYELHTTNPPIPGTRIEAIVIGKYIADFRYRCGPDTIIEDVKGVRTPLYRWKKKHVEAEYGITITEIT